MHFRHCAALLTACALMASAALPAFAESRVDLQQVIKDQEQREREAEAVYAQVTPDEYVNLSDRSGKPDTQPLTLPLYFGGTEEQRRLTAVVKTETGANLNARSSTSRVEARVCRLESGKQNDYFLLTLTAAGGEEEGPDEDFAITLTGGGNKLRLEGELRWRKEFVLVSGLDETLSYSPFCRFSGEIEETATVRCSDSVRLTFLGDYGDESADLRFSSPESDPDLALPEDGTTLYRFHGSPQFEDQVTVEIDAAPGSKLYRVQRGTLYRQQVDYVDGMFRFQTDYLADYVVIE